MSKVSEARAKVLALDHFQCVAPRLDSMAGLCYDKWGAMFSGFDPTGAKLEVNRETDEPMFGSDSERGPDGERIKAHEDVDRMVTLCPGHHRGTGPNHGHVWAQANHDLLRKHLLKRKALNS